MSTIYTLECTAPNGSKCTLIITDSLIPTNDTWESKNPDDWDPPNGAIASWGQPDARLEGCGATPCGILENFNKNSEPGDTGDGGKNTLDGNFPIGSFRWKVTKKE